jgi:uroporphyrinogen decarboxylase
MKGEIAVEEASPTPESQQATVIPSRPLVFSACRRVIGASFREFSLKPEVVAESLIAGLAFLGVKKEDRVFSPWVDLSVEAADFGQKMIYPEDSTAHPDYSDPLIKDVSDYRKLERVDLKASQRMRNMVETVRLVVESEGAGIGGFCLGPLGVLSMMRGAEHLFRDCVLHPREVKAALETITETLIEYSVAQCDAGAIGVCLDTLFASWNGLSREQWEDIEGPFAKEIADAVRARGGAIFIHNCGDGPYFDSQIRSMEPSVISFAQLPDDCPNAAELKTRYGNQVTLMGYIDTTLLTYGTPYQVMQACKIQIDELGSSPMGYVLAPGCEFPPDAPFENALAIMRAAEIYG